MKMVSMLRGKTGTILRCSAVAIAAFGFAARAGAASLETVGSVATPGSAEKVAVSGNIAGVIAGQPADVHFIDVSDPAAPFIAGSFDFGGSSASGIALSGNFAYVSYFNSETTFNFTGVRAIDISDPSSPTDRGGFDFATVNLSDSGARSVAAQGTTVFATSHNHVLSIDFSDPASPVLLGETKGASGESINLMGGQRFLTVFANTVIRVFTRANPHALKTVGVYVATQPFTTSSLPGFPFVPFANAAAADASGTHVYIGLGGDDTVFPDGWEGGDGILRVAFRPRGQFPEVEFLNAIYTNKPVNALAVSPFTGVVFAAHGEDGVRAYGPLLQELAHADAPGVAQDIALKGNLVFVADGDGGLVIMRFRPGN